MNYLDIKLSETDIETGTYKEFLGGGEEHWKIRGAFQLYFLQRMGLASHHDFLDVGCGPIRGGAHFINYLDAHKYFGIDANEDFIRVARTIVDRDPELRKKSPALQPIHDFDFSALGQTFSYMLAFSVLNHCPPSARIRFFQTVVGIMRSETKIYITHADWLGRFALVRTGLRRTKTFRNAHDISPDLDLRSWGWTPPESIFPIVEIGLA